jgi:hypothetical protein
MKAEENLRVLVLKKTSKSKDEIFPFTWLHER